MTEAELLAAMRADARRVNARFVALGRNDGRPAANTTLRAPLTAAWAARIDGAAP